MAYQKQWYGCSAQEAKAKWKSALASPHVHREKVDGVWQVAVKKPTEILHGHSIDTEERTNAKPSNMDKMTAKQLLSDHSESHTFGAESSGLGTAALAKRGAVAASIGTGSDASDSDDNGLRRPVRSEPPVPTVLAGLLCLRGQSWWTMAAPARVARGREHQGFFEVRKTVAKGDYSLSEDDKDEHEGVSRVLWRWAGRVLRLQDRLRDVFKKTDHGLWHSKICAWKIKDNISRLRLDVKGKLEDAVCAHEDWLEAI